MTAEEFEKVFDARVAKAKKVLVEKAKEYGTAGDRLYNFKRGAEVLGCHPAQCLRAYMTKHLVSLFDLVDKLANGETVSEPMLDEKLGDTFNYLVLLEALFKDEPALPGQVKVDPDEMKRLLEESQKEVKDHYRGMSQGTLQDLKILRETLTQKVNNQ